MINYNNITESEKERIKSLHNRYKLLSEQEESTTGETQTNTTQTTERKKMCNQTRKRNCHQPLLDLQVKLNDKKGAGLVEDGLYGPKTYGAIKTHLGIDLKGEDPFGNVNVQNNEGDKKYYINIPDGDNPYTMLNTTQIKTMISNGKITMNDEIWYNGVFINISNHQDFKNLFNNNNVNQQVGSDGGTQGDDPNKNQNNQPTVQAAQAVSDNWESEIEAKS